MTCKKAQEFLEKNRISVNDREDARKSQRGRAEALALARSADKVIAARGKKLVTFDMKKNPPDEETLLAHILGPSRKLRAPTARRGRTLLVGFSEDAYRELLSRTSKRP